MMRLIIGVVLAVIVGQYIPEGTPWYIAVFTGALLMGGVLFTFRPRKEPEQDG